MSLALTLFTIGVVGFTLYRSHALMLLLCLELVLLAITVLALLACISYDDGLGQTLSIVYVCIALFFLRVIIRYNFQPKTARDNQRSLNPARHRLLIPHPPPPHRALLYPTY